MKRHLHSIFIDSAPTPMHIHFMFDKLRQQALVRGSQLLTHPKVMKLMADPRFMNALMRGIEFKGRVESDVAATLRSLAARLNLVTKDELEAVQQSLHNLQTRVAEEPLHDRGDHAQEKAAS